MVNASRIVLLGFILTITGMFLILIGNIDNIGGFVYVFPFFFFGSTEIIPSFFIVLSAIATIAYFYYISRNFLLNQSSRISDKPQYLCPNCGAKLDGTPLYCSICGLPLESKSDEEYYS